MNRNIRNFKGNPSKRGKPPHITNSRGHISAPTFFHKPLDHGHQQLDENPFSHLALEIEMDRPSANPFDKGVMPSFDDRAIDEDYRNENSKKFSGRVRDDRKSQTKRPSVKEFAPPPLLLNDVIPTERYEKDVNTTATHTKRPLTKEFAAPPPLLLDNVIPTERYGKDVNTTAAPVCNPIHVRNISDVHQELDLDDFLPKPSAIVPSVDLKPQINIRSRSATVPHVDVKPRINIPHRKPVPQPMIAPFVAPVAPFVAPVAPVTQSKPVIDYFGTQSSNQSKKDVDEKEEYFRESQLEANKILFGVEEPSRPLTNVEVSKRKKLILKLVDQKLKLKLSELMNRLGDRTNAETQERNDTFEDQMKNLVPDSVPDNANPDQTQNWAAYPTESSEQTWNDFQLDGPNKDHQPNWPIRPPMYQHNPGWIESHMNPFPPGVDPMHNIRYPRMPPMRPQWNPNQWHPHLRPPEPQQWQPQPNWNMQVRPMNPHLMQPNLSYQPDDQRSNSNYPVPLMTRLDSEKPAADIELEQKEKEFLERTLLGSKNHSQRRDADSDRRRSPGKSRRRSRERSRRSHERSNRSRSRGNHGSQDLSRDRSRRENERNRTSSNRSLERILHRGISSPSRSSPLVASPSRSFRGRSRSFDCQQEMFFEVMADQFDAPICEPMPMYRSSSRELRQSNDEDLRVRLSQRRNRENRSRSPADLRNKLLSDSQRRHRTDDLRNQLSERSRKRSRSKSRSRSSKRSSKPDVDAELDWIKFNNIVGMLMNVDRDAELTSEEMSEKKEIMRLLLENPDLLELDEKFVYKFGKSRLTLAVKEAENILYPNGVPNERIASLISKKIAGLSTDGKKNVSKQKDSVPIEWIKLCSIVDQLLGVTVGVRKNVSVSDSRMVERDELLLKVSEDPNLLLTLGSKYGHRNVEWAAKFAKKILYHNGVRDKRVNETIAKERVKIMNRAGKTQSRNSSESDSKSNLKEWNQLAMHVTRLVQSTLDKFEKMSRADVLRKDELLVQMSRDPDSIRSDTRFTDNVDKAILNDIIGKCKDVIASVKSNKDKLVVQEFERQRTKLINFLKSRKPSTTAHEEILSRISCIFGKGHERWTAEEKKEREQLTEVLIKDPESLQTNTKAIERIGDKLDVGDIVNDVKKILSKLEPSKAKGPKKFHISSSKVIDIPFVVKIDDASDQLNDSTKTVLLKALRDMISEIENPPKPKLLQQRYVDKRVEVVCANLLTFEWLKRAIASDFEDKWSGAELKIERVPVETKIARDKLKPVVVVFKDTRATLPFDDIVDEIKKENSKLYPERWELLDARGKDGDYKKKIVGIDIESLAALEQMNRFARFGRSLVYFDISYMGNNVPNFEATYQ